MVSLFLCNSSLKLPPTPTTKPPNLSNTSTKINLNWPKKTIVHALTGALSLSLLISSPSSIAVDTSPSLQTQPSSSSSSSSSSPSSLLSSENCQEEEMEQGSDTAPDLVSNEEIVAEAWEIVNDGFLDAGRHRWSPDTWRQKKEDILGSSVQTRSKAHDIIKRMLASLGDPYTRFLSHDEFSKMARYDMTGIGINLRELPDDKGVVKLKVLGLILDGPAHAAGVRQGDEVISVNGVDVKGKSAFEVSSLLQGPNETFVNIEVKHGICGPIQSVEVQRQLVARTPVFYRLEQIENGTSSVGYMRLKEFNALARKDLVIAMKRLQDMGASYFILDLRDNLGGLVQAGVEIAKLFLNEGDTDRVNSFLVWVGRTISSSRLVNITAPFYPLMVIYTAGRDPQYQKAISAESAPLISAPVIILVNNKTASASEIVASALHDNCRAVLVGERTFGKGLIQSVFELHDGSGVVVTVGKYVTPNHMDINGNGIEPDFQKIPAWADVKQRLSQCNISRQG